MDSPMQEQKSVISEAIDLKMALEDVLNMIIEPLPTTGNRLETPQSGLKLDNLRNNIIDCREITKEIAKGLRLLI
jgi:hypothetical protein